MRRCGGASVVITSGRRNRLVVARAAGGAAAHDGPRDVVFNVPEDKVGLIKALAGQPGRLKVRLWGGAETLPAQVREVAAAADPVTRTFAVKADLEKAPATSAVQLGQTATVVADMPTVSGITKLPLSALREAQGKTAVWVVDKATMTVASVVVQVAGADGNEAVVSGGLTPANWW